MTLRRRGWSLRQYMAGFMGVVLVVAALAELAVHSLTEQDARQAAQADATFAARVAANEIENELNAFRETTDERAANPQAAVVASTPNASCGITLAGGIAFSSGHLDIVTPDGSVVCSSRPRPIGPVYARAPWLPIALHTRVTTAAFLDPATDHISAVVAAPTLVITLAGVAVMLVTAFVVCRRIAEPVRRLSQVMRGASSGAAVNAVAGTGAAEVADLAEDFDKLMESVKRELAERLTSEQKAMVSERNYRMLFESHPQPMWLYDIDTLAFLKVNDAAGD